MPHQAMWRFSTQRCRVLCNISFSVAWPYSKRLGAVFHFQEAGEAHHLDKVDLPEFCNSSNERV
jgi:hypothetical protein